MAVERITDELDRTAEIGSETVDSAERRPALIVLSGGVLGKRYVLDSMSVGIGREVDNVISLNHSTVSRYHARITLGEDSFLLEDLESRNGTFLNGERIEEKVPIDLGDTIRLGGAVLKLVPGGDTEARFHEEIYRRTILDELTGLANRRHLAEFLEREIARARRHRRPLSIAMVDIDHFKHVNDDYGHEAGDLVLREIATTIQQNVRRDELAARYGGEEFVVVLPETDCAGALRFAERLTEAVRERTFELGGEKISLTLSVGITEYERGQKTEDLIRVADEKLYRAKEEGRDRIVWCD